MSGTGQCGGYYPRTREECRMAIIRRFPGTVARERDRGGDLPSHLLWMLDRIGSMDRTDPRDAAKAGRWLGWVLAEVEILGLWENARSRDLVREDVRAGADISLGG